MTLWAWSRGAALPGDSLATAALPFALALATGTGLLRGQRSAITLAYATQLLQIPIVVLPAVVWRFIAGAKATVVFTATDLNLFAGFEAGWFVGRANDGQMPMELGLNLAPLLVIALLWRATSKAFRSSVRDLSSRPAA